MIFLISLLVLGISKEIEKRYTSQSFQQLAYSAMIAAVFAGLSLISTWLYPSASSALEGAALLLLWLGISHIYGLKIPNWLFQACAALQVVIAVLTIVIHKPYAVYLNALSFTVVSTALYLRHRALYPLIGGITLTSLYSLYLGLSGRLWGEICGIVIIYILIIRIIAYLHAVLYQSTTDRLTGLYNRVVFLQYVTDFMQAGKKVGVIFMDIDNFKRLNDTKGHAAGDEALKGVASTVRDITKNIGVAGRYGGEEMVAVVVDQDPIQVAETIREQIIIRAGVTASIGVAISKPGQSAEQLVNVADKAMYEAKSTGKNKVVSA